MITIDKEYRKIRKTRKKERQKEAENDMKQEKGKINKARKEEK
jgi:hypothetical protein